MGTGDLAAGPLLASSSLWDLSLVRRKGLIVIRDKCTDQSRSLMPGDSGEAENMGFCPGSACQLQSE